MSPDIILYDLAGTKGGCFSPVVWRIRLMLNYKQILYRTVFVEFPDIEPTLKDLGMRDTESPETSSPKYTVPAIQHLPTGTNIMGSFPIAKFLESTYPEPPCPLITPFGKDVLSTIRPPFGAAHRMSAMAREVDVLSPRSQEYYRRTREAALGHPLEELLVPYDDPRWDKAYADVRKAGELLLTNREDGPFVLGGQPSYVDFTIIGGLLSASVVSPESFERIVGFPGYHEMYVACRPFMLKND